MKLSIIASGLALASTALGRSASCITRQQAKQLVERYSTIMQHINSDLGDPTATAEALLIPEYQEISDSILSLEGAPVRCQYYHFKLRNPANQNNYSSVA